MFVHVVVYVYQEMSKFRSQFCDCCCEERWVTNEYAEKERGERFVKKIEKQSFVINTRDSNPACGSDAKAYCDAIKRMVNRCADVSSKTGLKLKFRIQKRPSWTSRQASGANNCGHYQASSCQLPTGSDGTSRHKN